MVLSGVGAGFLLYVLSKVTEDLSKAELHASESLGVAARVGGRPHPLGLAVPGGRVVAIVAARHRMLPHPAAPQCAATRGRLTAAGRGFPRWFSAWQLPARSDLSDGAPRRAQSFTYNPPAPRRGSAARRQRRTNVPSRRPRSTTTTTTRGCRPSATCRCSITGQASRPTRSSTTRRPSGCTPRKATSPDQCGRQDHLRQRSGREQQPQQVRSNSLQLRHRRRDADGRNARGPLERQLHVFENGVYTACASRTIRRSRRCGRSRARASFTTRTRRCVFQRAVVRRSDGVYAVFSRRPTRP